MEIANELKQEPEDCAVTIRVMDGYTHDEPEVPLSEIQRRPVAQYANKEGTASWAGVKVHFSSLKLWVTINRDRDRGDDVIHVTYQEDPLDPAAVSRSLGAIQRQFGPLNRAAAIARALGPEMAEFYQRREEGLSRLEALTQRLVDETHDYRIRLDAETAEHKRALTVSVNEKAKALEAAHEERSAALVAREQALDARRRELDDRSARHARRVQSRSFQKKISDRSQKFALTPETQRKRWPIHAIFGLLLFAAGLIVARSLLFPATATEGVALWLELGRLPLGVVGFALTSVFYIRWNDQWFRQHANQEFRLQQLALDVDRAGYATEMLLEWQEDKGGEMPSVLVERLTTGLFTDQTTERRVRHPAEDVTAALLKASSNVRIDVPGIGELTLTGRQLRGLDRKLMKKRDN